MKLPISALVMIMIAGICFFLFVSFNYAFHGEGGIKEVIWEAGNNSLSGSHKTLFDGQMDKLSQGFGLSGVMFLGIAVLLFVVDALGSPPDRRL